MTNYRMPSDDLLVVIVERDTNDPLRSGGALIWEQYTAEPSFRVEERAQSLADGGKYGRVWVGKVEEIREVGPKPHKGGGIV